ncbi:hypothetical protein JQ543_21565 [Bradyrhizobium diazoefficiens]|nr:hypothetical protein [Bradyrhizobium diazoefficiens]MBR0850346.1 hypothetical protein [Bradyrhizobium diazoefficiens]
MVGIIVWERNAAGAGTIGKGNFFAIRSVPVIALDFLSRSCCSRIRHGSAPRFWACMRRAVARSRGTRRNTPGFLRDFPGFGAIDSARPFYFAMQQLFGLDER